MASPLLLLLLTLFPSVQVKSGGAVEPLGTRITFHITDPSDMTRDLLKVTTPVGKWLFHTWLCVKGKSVFSQSWEKSWGCEVPPYSLGFEDPWVELIDGRNCRFRRWPRSAFWWLGSLLPVVSVRALVSGLLVTGCLPAWSHDSECPF